MSRGSALDHSVAQTLELLIGSGRPHPKLLVACWSSSGSNQMPPGARRKTVLETGQEAQPPPGTGPAF